MSSVALPRVVAKHSAKPRGELRKALVLRASRSSLAQYAVGQLLHIGVCDSLGMVHSFDRAGVTVEKWRSCMVMPLTALDEEQRRHWDDHVWSHSKREALRQCDSAYRAKRNNCFDFVLRFLNHMRYAGRYDHTKASLTQQLLCPVLGTFLLRRLLLPRVSPAALLVMRRGQSTGCCDVCGAAAAIACGDGGQLCAFCTAACGPLLSSR